METVEGKGLGVIARRSLPPGLLIPYGGVPVEAQEVRNLRKNSGRKSNPSDYIVANKWDSCGNEIAWVDGRIRRYPDNRPKFVWIATFCNEPSNPGDQYNAKLVAFPRDSFIKEYPDVSCDSRVFVQTMKPVPKGAEILVDYHWSRRRYASNRRGYCPLRLLQKPSPDLNPVPEEALSTEEPPHIAVRRENARILHERKKRKRQEWELAHTKKSRK